MVPFFFFNNTINILISQKKYTVTTKNAGRSKQNLTLYFFSKTYKVSKICNTASKYAHFAFFLLNAASKFFLVQKVLENTMFTQNNNRKHFHRIKIRKNFYCDFSDFYLKWNKTERIIPKPLFLLCCLTVFRNMFGKNVTTINLWFQLLFVFL